MPVTPTYEGCAYVWASHDMPELSRKLNAELQDISMNLSGLAYAYGEDCVLSGLVRMAADRLTDMLNEHDEYLLVNVLVEGLAGDRAVEVTEVLVRRDELFLVHAAGPRGNQDRRHRTRSHPVAVQLGPYHVRGYLHVLPGIDPEWIQTYGKVALEGQPVSFEKFYPVPLNRWYEVFAYQPAPRQFAVIFMDITARKEAESAASAGRS